MKRIVRIFALTAIATLLGCARLPEPALPTMAPTAPAPVEPTPTPPPQHTSLIVCLMNEPPSLYLYGDTTREADAVLQAIYDGPIDLLGFQYKPVILTSVPALNGGGAKVQPATIRGGDVYLDPVTQEPEVLSVGDPYLPSGCGTQACSKKYQGGDIQVDQMVVDFTLLSGLKWSDGKPLTSADSVLSYHLDGDPATPTTKYLYDRTLSYVAVDDRTVEWTGIPGFMDGDFQNDFWSPLPAHVLSGMTADQVKASDLATRAPIGWGPYQIESWQPGQSIVMTPNPNYFRGATVGQRFNQVIFRFLGGDAGAAIDQLQTGECDYLDEGLLDPTDLVALQQGSRAGAYQLASVPGPLVTRLDFNLKPAQPGAGAGLFADPSTRRAIGLCIDRKGLVEELLGGQGAITDTYLPVDHPLYASPAGPLSYDPGEAATLLDKAGWRPASQPGGVRAASGVAGVPDGTPLSIHLQLPTGALNEALGKALASDLSQCGIEVSPDYVDPQTLFASWPDGPAFGRTFEMVGWSWPVLHSPPCDMFASWEIPMDGTPYGNNASGFSEAAYDQACEEVMFDAPGTSGYLQGVAETQSIFASELPAVPLYVRPRLVAYADWLCGVEVDPSPLSELWGIENFKVCDSSS